MNDPLGEVHREAYVAPTGRVHVANKAFKGTLDSAVMVSTGSLHIGLYGVTVTQPDGSSWMYPWRVVQAVKIEPVKATGDGPK